MQEIFSLTLASVQPYAGSPESQAAQLEHAGLPLLQPECSHWRQVLPSPQYLLRVRKARTGHDRLLLLDARTSRAVHDWLEVRHISLG